MQKEYEGTFLRCFTTSDHIVLVLEPMDEGGFSALADHLLEVRLQTRKPQSIDTTKMEKDPDTPIWIKILEGTARIEGEMFSPVEFPCTSAESVKRDYDTNDLRAKFMHLSTVFKSAEETTGARLKKLQDEREALEKYVSSHQHTWTLKRDFFAEKDPSKAREFEAKIEVLKDIEQFIKQT